MKANDRSEEVEIDRLRKAEKWMKYTIDNQKLNSIVKERRKKWMKVNVRYDEVEIYCLKKEKSESKPTVDIRKLISIV